MSTTLAGVEELKPRLADAVSAVLKTDNVTNPIYRVIAARVIRQDHATGDTDRFILDRLESIDERLVAFHQAQLRDRAPLTASVSGLHHLRVQGAPEDIERLIVDAREGRLVDESPRSSDTAREVPPPTSSRTACLRSQGFWTQLETTGSTQACSSYA